MNRSINYIILIPAFISLGFVGCKKLVEIDAPLSQLSTPSVFSSNATATSALLNIYQSMFQKQEMYSIEVETGLASDEFDSYLPSNAPVYTNALDPFATYNPWSDAYNFIYQSNAILEGLNNNPAITPAVAKQLTGEAKFIRAFWYFYLTSFYGDVPLVLSTDYTINKSIARSPQKDVYKQMVQDLTDAIGNMNDNFIDASDTTSTLERIRPNKYTAMALLARTYLYIGDYVNAEKQADTVINNTGLFSLATDMNTVFLANNNEAIWQLATPLDGGSNGGINTNEGQGFILISQPTIVSLSPQLMGAFEPGDLRKKNWVDSFVTSAPVATYYYVNKYKIMVDATPGNTEEYTTLLRLSEQYLIRAEARILQGRIAEGIADLNILRARARDTATAAIPNPLPDLNTGLSPAAALAATLHERQVELFTECGHRWFDMIRMGFANTIMGAPGNVCQAKGGVWTPTAQLFPIPQRERNSDANLTQNPGYN